MERTPLEEKVAEDAQPRQLQEQARLSQHYGRQSLKLPMPQHPPPQQMGPTSTPTASKPTPNSTKNGGGPPKQMPQGISNPMYAKADFNLPQHPYQNFYVAPNHHHQQIDLEQDPHDADHI